VSVNGHPPGEPGECAAAASVAGLAREVEQLRRTVAEHDALRERLDRLAGLVARLAETIATAPGTNPAAAAAPSWLDHPAEHGRPVEASKAARAAEDLLTKLHAWVAGIYLAYSDARSLPGCWMWHPDIVEELLWLHLAWLAAHSPDAPNSAVGDWHDRQRPGVVRRVNGYASACSLGAHRPGGDRHTTLLPNVTDASAMIADWWATNRDQPAPEPTDQQLAEAAARAMRPRR
jgi:hypothetical protein